MRSWQFSTLIFGLSLLAGCDAIDDVIDAGGLGGLTERPVTPKDLVTDADFTRLLIEIDAVSGHGPDADALAAFEDELEAYRAAGHLAKDAIRVVVDETDLEAQGGDDKKWAFADQDALHDAHQSVSPEDGEVAIHLLYVNGGTENDDGNSRVLGYAYGGDRVTMFRGNLDFGCERASLGPLGGALTERACEIGEAGVLVHELGHLFGLVNNGTAMVNDHQDEEHGAHDDNEDCLMYWLADSADFFDVIGTRFGNGNNGVPKFDAACLADLDASIAAARE